MSKKFDPNMFAKLDNPVRREILPPEEIVKSLNIDREDIVADIGCGVGYFTFPFSEVSDKVYGIDISSIMIDELNRRIKEKDVHNIRTIQSTENNLMLEEKVDVIFSSTVFHELNEPLIFIEACKDHLNEDGQIIIIDWNKIQEDFGPPIHKRVDVYDVVYLLKSIGLENVESELIGESFYLVKGTASGSELQTMSGKD